MIFNAASVNVNNWIMSMYVSSSVESWSRHEVHGHSFKFKLLHARFQLENVEVTYLQNMFYGFFNEYKES